MKKLFIVILLMLFLTGCGNKKLKCEKEEVVGDNKYKTTLNFEFKDDKVENYKMFMEVTLSKNNLPNFEYYYNSFEETFKEYNDRDGATLKLEKTENSYSALVTIKPSKYNRMIKLFDKNLNYEDTKIYYENTGYICK